MAFSSNSWNNGAPLFNSLSKTRWSLVLQACAGSPEALEDLSRSYWPVIFAFLRRKNLTQEDAQDVTQNTFAHLLKKGALPAVHPDRGRFRSFLYACAEHEASHFRERNGAEKRGFNRIVSFDSSEAGQPFNLLPAAEPPQAFDRAWSKIIVSRALEKLEADYKRLGKGALYHALLPLLNSGHERGSHRALAAKLGLSEGNTRVTWLRFKTSFVEHMRSEVAQTLEDPAELDAELRHLMSAWLSSER